MQFKFKKTVLGLAALSFAAAQAQAADYKGPNLKGETITVSGTWLTGDEANFRKVFSIFEKATGATVKYTGSGSFEQQIVIDTKAGSAPNVAIFPQPGLAANLAAQGFLTPLGDTSKNWVVKNYGAGQSWADLGTYTGKDGKKAFYAFPYKADLKSLVWYVPENFKEKGYKVPKTMEELKSLTERIAKDGGKPWCIGLGSDDATGWPATDWVEDMMLRTQSPADYDKWTTNQLKFNDPKVIAAIDEFGWFAKNDKFVDGGAKGVASTSFRDAPKGLFGAPPKCYMHRQASFITTFFPEGKEKEADFFYLPAYASKKLGNPVLGGGTLFGITKDSKGAREFINFLQSPQAHEAWMSLSGFLTPHKGVDTKKYASDALRRQGEIMTKATTFRFDGSDLMPPGVGAGSFWKGMVSYTSGKTAKEVADDIQKSWDGLKK